MRGEDRVKDQGRMRDWSRVRREGGVGGGS